jgi:glycerophosphoryl diester phosphodiesterase
MTMIWAHRGASAVTPENTLPAFARAIELKADGIELDVQLTKDGIPVVFHDFEIDHLSEGNGLLKDYTLAELRKINFNKRFPEQGFVTLPTLAEVFDLFRPTNLVINVEIKSGKVIYPGIEEKVLALEKEFSMAGRVWYSSFNHFSVKHIQRLSPTALCGILYDCGLVDPWIYAVHLGVQAIHPHHTMLAIPGLMDACREAGIAIHAWTIDHSEDLVRAFSLGIDAVISNKPDFARTVLNTRCHII